jgi:hypothetical protein
LQHFVPCRQWLEAAGPQHSPPQRSSQASCGQHFVSAAHFSELFLQHVAPQASSNA